MSHVIKSIEKVVQARVAEALMLIDDGWTEEDAIASVRRSSTLGPESWKRVVFYVNRGIRLRSLYVAIREGRAYLDTAFGRYRVRSYRDDTGWAVCNNTSSELSARHFMTCLEDIKTTPAGVTA